MNVRMLMNLLTFNVNVVNFLNPRRHMQVIGLGVKYGMVTQLVEFGTFNSAVAGSSPAHPTNNVLTRSFSVI